MSVATKKVTETKARKAPSWFFWVGVVLVGLLALKWQYVGVSWWGLF